MAAAREAGHAVLDDEQREPATPVVGSVEVRATVMTRSACMPPVMKVLAPLTTKSSPSRTAVVRMPARSGPVPGSVMATAVSSVPTASPGNHRARCSSFA
jgi:hypothetical protein